MIKIVSTKRDYRTFAQAGVDFSKKYPRGITSLLSSELGYFNPEKNFFLRIGGVYQCFLYLKNEKVLGRIAAMIHPEMPENGLVGLYDCIEDQSVSDALLDAAIGFLKSRNCVKATGPVNFSIYHNYRFMTEGFEDESYYGEPRNPPYYPQFFQHYGFSMCHYWSSFYLNRDDMDRYIADNSHFAEKYDQAGYQTHTINKKNKFTLLKNTWAILQESYHVFPLFTGISSEDFLKEYARMPGLLDKDASFFGYNPKAKMVSFILVLQDITAALRAMNGKTDLWARIRFLMNRRKTFMANVSQGGSTAHFIREALVLGKRQFGEPISIANANIFKSVYAVRQSAKYQAALFTLVRDEGLMNVHLKGYWSKKRKYELYEMSLLQS
jgi:hypothetical protein